MKIKSVSLASIFLFLDFCLFAQSNDHIFPATGKASAAINFDKNGFVIKGRRTYIVSAGIEYARVPHELWQDRLLRLKRAGFNCVEIYTFWNFHEPREGVFDFKGDHDLAAFLKLVHRLDMYAIVRVGPYYCAEWDSGGYPLWLRFKNDVLVRQHNKAFEKYVSRFFHRLLPIVVSNQIHRGGPVILVQLENEHPAGWGTYMPNEYFKFLQNEAMQAGIEVPYFFSGLHHATDPAGRRTSLDDPARPNPWFSTEYWSMWYDYYGNSRKDAAVYGRRTWKIIAGGSGGYNIYMAHGGTNFGYTNNDEDAASYDYGAAVGQAGNLRQTYYQFKRIAYFARSFEKVLADSRQADIRDTIMVTNHALKVYARQNHTGSVIFIDNRSDLPAMTYLNFEGRQWPSGKGLELEAGEIVPVVRNYTLFKNVIMDLAAARILGLQRHKDNIVTLVVYGKQGTTGALKFTTRGVVKIIEEPVKAFDRSSDKVELRFSFGATSKAYCFKCGDKVIRILAVSDRLADRTWFVSTPRQNYVVSGPAYVGAAVEKEKGIELHTEQYWADSIRNPINVYAVKICSVLGNSIKTRAGNLIVKGWVYKNATRPAMRQTSDALWKKSATALEMGADGDLSANAWYRTRVFIPDSGIYTIKIPRGGDRVSLFVDGKMEGSANIKNQDLTIHLQRGEHLLAFFVSHDGRDKLFNYIGSLDKVDAKGLSGNITIKKGIPVYLGEWKMIKARAGDTLAPPASFKDGVAYDCGQDAFSGKKGFAWFQAELVLTNNRIADILHFKSVDDNAIVFVNGRKVVAHRGYNIPFDVFVKDYLHAGSNAVSVFIANDDGAGGINKAVEVSFGSQEERQLLGWTMKGGPGDYLNAGGWKSLDIRKNEGGPVFFKGTFSFDYFPPVNAMYRVTTGGLGHGSVWINGHNLGRYPEKIKVDGMYIPECWLKPGLNEIVIFDEDGNAPQSVRIQPEYAASRNSEVIKVNI